MTQQHPIPDELLNCLEIDEASPSGLSWQTKKTKSGKRAGYLNDKGYWIVRFKGKNYKSHRLILLISGKPQPTPGSEVDHIDRNPSNNLLSNLRWVDRSGNLANRKVLGSVPYRYVHKSRGRYTGQYTHPRTRRQVFVGRFVDALSAHLAAVAHRLENHWIDS